MEGTWGSAGATRSWGHGEVLPKPRRAQLARTHGGRNARCSSWSPARVVVVAAAPGHSPLWAWGHWESGLDPFRGGAKRRQQLSLEIGLRRERWVRGGMLLLLSEAQAEEHRVCARLGTPTWASGRGFPKAWPAGLQGEPRPMPTPRQTNSTPARD